MPPMFENKSQPKFLLVATGSGGRFINKFGESVTQRCNAIEFYTINAVVNWVRKNDLCIDVSVYREDVVMVPSAQLTEV